MKLNKCCQTHQLSNIKELYQSNADMFTLLQCSECRAYWLYRKLEENWLDNVRFGWNEYEAWYIGIHEEDLPKVMALEFDTIFLTHGYLHLSTIEASQGTNWKKIGE